LNSVNTATDAGFRVKADEFGRALAKNEDGADSGRQRRVPCCRALASANARAPSPLPRARLPQAEDGGGEHSEEPHPFCARRRPRAGGARAPPLATRARGSLASRLVPPRLRATLRAALSPRAAPLQKRRVLVDELEAPLNAMRAAFHGREAKAKLDADSRRELHARATAEADAAARGAGSHARANSDYLREQGQAQATLRREQVRRGARCRRPAADDPPPKIRVRRRRARAHRRRRRAPAAPPARRRTSRWARCRARCRA